MTLVDSGPQQSVVNGQSNIGHSTTGLCGRIRNVMFSNCLLGLITTICILTVVPFLFIAALFACNPSWDKPEGTNGTNVPVATEESELPNRSSE